MIKLLGFLELEDKPIAEGAAGRVHKAYLRESRYGLNEDSTIAVKVIKPEILQHENEPKRLLTEYKVGSTIHHENLVQIFELIEPSTDNENYLLIMELVEGKRLSELLKDSTLILEDKINLAIGILKGVRELHSHSILHRDIKPDNIVVAHISPKVVDYGVSKILGDQTITPAQQFLGTLRFSSPQAVTGESATKEDDSYSLGAVLYELFTGKELFHETTNKALLVDAIRTKKPELINLEMKWEEFPYYLRLLIEKMLSKVRETRPTIEEALDRISSKSSEYYISELEKFHFEKYNYKETGKVVTPDLYTFPARCNQCNTVNILYGNQLRGEGVDAKTLMNSLARTFEVYINFYCNKCLVKRPCVISRYFW